MKLFTWKGIEVKAGFFALALFFMMTSSMFNMLITTAGFTKALALPLGALLAVGLLASVVAHEYGHALVAKAFGMEITEIIIHLLGGAALIKSPFPSAKAEFFVAIAGPIVSFIIGGVFVWIGMDPFFGFLSITVLACIKLFGIINLILGAFNLIPAFPLDGGRVLRACLWGATGNFSKATKIASITGFLFGGLLMGYGLTGGGIWNIVMGLFVCLIAYTEAKRIPKTIAATKPEDRITNQEIE